ncbi:sodium/solute symporter [Candidatus Neomarinimicrobiota bacterium]
MIGDHIYLIGGNNGVAERKNFWRLNIKENQKWEILEPWPGHPRSHLIAAAQSDGRENCLYIFSGRYNHPTEGWLLLDDGYKYTPSKESWSVIANVGTNLSDTNAVCVMAAPGIAIGANHILVFGGANGELFRQVEQDMPRQIKSLQIAGKIDEANHLTEQMWAIYTDHPGFSRDILVYHTITDTWNKIDEFPVSEIEGRTVGSHVTTTAVSWDNNIIIPGGEVRPGVRTTRNWHVKPTVRGRFGFTNITVLSVYLSLLVFMGVYLSRREKSTEDFFKASGRVPWWAAGLSIFGTQLSAITFMAIPAKSFATDWTWLTMNMTIIAVAPFIVFLFLPFYRRLNVTTAYEYIEKRFNVVVRVAASAMFILFQFARIGIVLYLPSIALSIVTGIDIWLCIVIMASLSILYTVLGGIEAVIWTDVLQVFVLLSGALVALLIIPGSVHGGFAGMIEIASDADKLRLLDFHLSLQSPTFWVLVLGGIGSNLISYGSDQTVIQRYLTTKDETDAARGIWLNGFLTIPASLIFFGLGTALFTFFKSNPGALDISMENVDSIFPWFIVTQLPAGVAGLLIAGIFAAAMSSLDSSMNSVAAAFTTDMYRRFNRTTDERRSLVVARSVTVIIGLCGMLFSLVMATWDIQSLWSEFMKYIGLFGGGLGGLFILAIFTQRANSRGALTGLVGSAVVQYVLVTNEMISGVLFAATGMIASVVIGYAASLFFQREEKNLRGLTLHSLNESEAPPYITGDK